MTADANTNYIPVDLATLKEGMLVDRSLYVFLPGNNRYFRLAKALYPLEARVLEKLQRQGQVFSDERPIDDRFPDLGESVRVVRELAGNAELAPFEKNRAIREATTWLAPSVLDREKFAWEGVLAVHFMHRAFGVPRPETMAFVSDLSVEMYERSLKLAACAGTMALWLGYSDAAFLAEFVENVFCEAIGSYRETPATPLEMIDGGEVPGVARREHRFRWLLADRALCERAGDELASVVELARFTSGGTGTDGELAKLSRAARKLAREFPFAVRGASGEAQAA
jgi:hypothetical protein